MSLSHQNVWQQILAQDALYNNYRFPNKREHHQRNLYLKRRSQLCREYSQYNHINNRDPQDRYNYSLIRKQLLGSRYGPLIFSASDTGHSSLRSKSRTGSLHSLIRQMDLDLSDGSHGSGGMVGNKSLMSRVGQVVPTNVASASRALAGQGSVEESYAFAGIQHVFDHCEGGVTRIRFAHNDATRLAVASEDGSVSICRTWPRQFESVLCVTRGHEAALTDLAWSSANDFLLTSAKDASVCLWSTDSLVLARRYSSDSLNVGSHILCVEFQPMNNNLFVAGGSDGAIQVVNLSTGKTPKAGRDKLGGAVTALAFEEAAGACLWVGNSLGVIQSYLFDVGGGGITRARRLTVSTRPCTVSSLQARAWIDREARNPCLLASASCNSLLFFRIVSADGQLVLKNKFPVRHSHKAVRSSFCPLISFRQGACVVTGSEDGNVLVFNVTAGQPNEPKHCITFLQGHSGAVIDVAVSCDELVLASCDDKGHVILWRRVSHDGEQQGGQGEGASVGE